MKTYNFYNTFEPMEFQDFARDIIQIRENIVLESFSEGKDRGIDGRYVGEDGYTIIFQAKRILHTNERIVNIVKKEKCKLDELVAQGIRIDRYILVLSGDVSVAKKIKIQEMLEPYVIEPQDIIGSKDLNNYLSSSENKYKSVEGKYYKLWIQNTDTLKKALHEIVNPQLVELSEMHLNDAVEKGRLFVETGIYSEALEKIQKSKVLIISGEPGVGKTTLANQIALYYLTRHQFDHYVYATSMNDLYIAKGIKGKKVIIFDDFWGGNGFDFFGNGIRVKDLVTFVEYIQKRDDYLLIMTTREYVLEQGLEKNADFRRLVESNKLDCRIEDYSELDKLRIYYGHLKYTSLTWNQAYEFRQVEQDVIDSPNYNPRVIEMFTKSITPDLEPVLCVEKFFDYLDCPSDFWKQIFNELSQEAKIVYLLMAIMPLPVEVHVLKHCYLRVVKAVQKELEWKGFPEIIIELEKTVIRTDLYRTMMAITYQNPSVKDFALELLENNFENYSDILQQSCIFYSQCVEYLKMLRKMPARNALYKEVMKKAIKLIRSESILFYDRYMKGFGAHQYQEVEKYHERYNTEMDCSERGFGRYFQLMLLYKNVEDEELQEWFGKKFEDITSEMEKYPEAVLWEDLQTYPEVAEHLEKEGVCRDIKKVIEVYVESLMRNREELDSESFRHSYKGQWEEYVYLNREKIGEYLNRYYRAEFCLAATTNDFEEFYYLENMCEEAFREYKIEKSKDLHEQIKQYAGWLDEKEDEKAYKEDESRGKRIQDIEETRIDFNENFLNAIMPTEIDDLGVWLEMKMVPKDTRMILESMWNRRDKFWSIFFYDEESLEFLIAFLEHEGELAKTVGEAINNLVKYMMDGWDISGDELFELLNSLSLIEDEVDVFSDKELEDMCPNGYAWSVNIIENMLSKRVLMHRHIWYRITNLVLAFCAYMNCVRQLSDGEREEYYKKIPIVIRDTEDELEINTKETKIDELINVAFKWQDDEESGRLFWDTLYQIDRLLFEKYVLVPTASELYDKTPGETKKEKANRFVDELEIVIYLMKTGEQLWGMSQKEKYLIVTSDLEKSPLQELTSTIFTEEQLEILRYNGVTYKETVAIPLKCLRERNLLESLGICEKVDLIWNRICELKEKKYEQ